MWKVQKHDTKEMYAMKEMSKARIVHKRSVHSVTNERMFLAQLRHPFLVNMHYAFQDAESLYLCLDLLSGGDLRYHMNKRKGFSEEESSTPPSPLEFMIACVMVGLEYLHMNGVLHRDMKPENLVLDESGYVRITDLGIAKVWTPENAQDTSGTLGYMGKFLQLVAPEVICKTNHNIEVDYFAVGVITYELMMGKRPYQSKVRKDLKKEIISRQVVVKAPDVPNGWSPQAADFITKVCIE